LGFGTKLTVRFFIVIVLMVVGMCFAQFVLDYQASRVAAYKAADAAMTKLSDDCLLIAKSNSEFAEFVSHDAGIINSLTSKNRHAAADAIDAIVKTSGYPGDLTLIDTNGKVFYSTDTPKFFDYSVEKSFGVHMVINQYQPWHGYTNFGPQGRIAETSLAPIRTSSGDFKGIVAAAQPLSQEFLTGMATKLPIEDERLAGIGLAVVSAQANPQEPPQMAVTPELQASHNPIIMNLLKKGVNGLPTPPNKILDLGICAANQFLPFCTTSQSFEGGDRWWRASKITDNGEALGVLLTTAPIAETHSQLTYVILLGSGLGVIVFFISLFMAGGITNSVTQPLQALIHRYNDLENQKKALPPLEGLEGEWLDLGENIDSAILKSRHAAKTMRNELRKQEEDFEVKLKAANDNSVHSDTLNRQIAQQSKQLVETSKQINFANRQSVLLQRKLDAVLQISIEGFLVLDQYGNVLSVNPVFLNWIGATEGELAGRLCFDLVQKPGEPKKDFHQGHAFAQHGGDPHAVINQFYPEGIIYHNHKDTAIEVLAHLQPVEGEDSSIQGYVMVLRDKSLRSEIARMRTEIVAMLVDSIRAPLVHAESDWQRILAAAAQTMHPSVGQPLAELHEHYENLLGVIDSLLMMYGNFVPPPLVSREQIVVNRLVADCLEEISPIARERQLALDYKSVTGLPNLTGNREAVHGIIMQLLEKLVGITSAGGRVRVETSAKSGEMRIGVLSSGPALANQEIVDMFAGFIEGKHSQAEYGSRLSMYLARNNVERLGGKIWAESDRGTSIYFTMPIV
jgi:PAS domain S-box-containing protein